ncbi:MAG: hypothetical protein WCI18_12255 [Pseudomonadota bacterium]
MTNKPFRRSVPLKERKLNIVYFLDSAKSRSFQLSLRSAALVSALFAAFTVLAVIGITGASQRALKIQVLSAENKELRKSLFDYQTRYEGAYAKAYPESEGTSNSSAVNTAIAPENLPTEKFKLAQKMAAKTPDSVSGSKSENGAESTSNFQASHESKTMESDLSRAKKIPDSSQNLADKKANSGEKTYSQGGISQHPSLRKEKVALQDGEKSGSASDTDSQSLAINNAQNATNKKQGNFPQISNAKIEQKDGSYLVRFELRSIPANTQLSGHLWVVGEFDNEGKKVFFTSPKSVEVDDSGVIKETQAGERYRVRNFTAKFLTLKVGTTKKSELRKITIGISDESGNRSSYPIDLTTVSGEMGQLSKGG